MIPALFGIRIYFPIDNPKLLPTIYSASSGLLLALICQPSEPCDYGSPHLWQLLLLLHAPPSSSWFSLDPKSEKPNTHLCLFCPTIGRSCLNLSTRNNLGAGSQVYMQTPGLGDPHLALQQTERLNLLFSQIYIEFNYNNYENYSHTIFNNEVTLNAIFCGSLTLLKISTYSMTELLIINCFNYLLFE